MSDPVVEKRSITKPMMIIGFIAGIITVVIFVRYFL